MNHLRRSSGFLRETKCGALTTLIKRFIYSENLSCSGITNIEHNKGSVRDYQKIKDKNKVSASNVVDTTRPKSYLEK